MSDVSRFDPDAEQEARGGYTAYPQRVEQETREALARERAAQEGQAFAYRRAASPPAKRLQKGRPSPSLITLRELALLGDNEWYDVEASPETLRAAIRRYYANHLDVWETSKAGVKLITIRCKVSPLAAAEAEQAADEARKRAAKGDES